ncbi:hypothetical protein [Desulfovibrio intestinalis]|uniref:Uncharacterized protein n=1 Tax=Desulfovibrio intestinalis TaxID=58621 RepID=A0A7W8C0K0_9BACT|nr:hypothetical protein [Desulfovibrio intestinalis]MBB5143351.1 hypothetical protein [Desulfovibrio intestinalis]
MEFGKISPLGTSEIILSMLGRKVASGQSLTITECLMALSASGAIIAREYGPGPAEMTVNVPQLPETVKGLLANYAG